jgi:hypothetical protein
MDEVLCSYDVLRAICPEAVAVKLRKLERSTSLATLRRSRSTALCSDRIRHYGRVVLRSNNVNNRVFDKAHQSILVRYESKFDSHHACLHVHLTACCDR